MAKVGLLIHVNYPCALLGFRYMDQVVAQSFCNSKLDSPGTPQVSSVRRNKTSHSGILLHIAASIGFNSDVFTRTLDASACSYPSYETRVSPNLCPVNLACGI